MIDDAHLRPAARRYATLPRLLRWFSDRCVLRQLDSADIDRIWKAVAHPAFAQCWTVATPRSEDEVADMVHSAQADWPRGDRYVMGVTRKQTQEFIGCIELRAAQARGVWLLDWFIHPHFVAEPLAQEAIAAACDLMFSALDAQTLYANCPRGHKTFERLLNDAGFIEMVPAGSLDPMTGRPRSHALCELGRLDWLAIRRAQRSESTPASAAGTTVAPRAELALL